MVSAPQHLLESCKTLPAHCARAVVETVGRPFDGCSLFKLLNLGGDIVLKQNLLGSETLNPKNPKP